MAERKKKVCSFCGRGEHDVKLLISGMNGYICDHCVAQAFDIPQGEPSAGRRR